MARFIGDKIGGYNKMKGGKKQKKQSGGVGGEPCHAGADSCRPNDSHDDSECESYMELQHLGPDVLLSQYEVCDAEPTASSAPVASKPAASPMQGPQPNFGTYRAVIRQPDEYDDGMGDAPCKTQCGDHVIGHGLASMVGLGDLTHATCEGEDGKQHKCKKAQSGGKKRKTRKHKKKAKKAHKKKTHKRKPKRKTRKHKKKAKKAHKKKTHKRRNVRHSTKKKGGVKSVRSKTPSRTLSRTLSRTSNLSPEDRKELKRREFGQKKIKVARPDGQGQGRTTWTGETPKTEPCCTKCQKSLCNRLTCSGVKQCAECNLKLEPKVKIDNFSLIPSYRMMDCMPPGEIIE